MAELVWQGSVDPARRARGRGKSYSQSGLRQEKDAMSDKHRRKPLIRSIPRFFDTSNQRIFGRKELEQIIAERRRSQPGAADRRDPRRSRHSRAAGIADALRPAGRAAAGPRRHSNISCLRPAHCGNLWRLRKSRICRPVRSSESAIAFPLLSR